MTHPAPNWWQAGSDEHQHRSLEGGASIELNDQSCLWRVDGGSVDVFAVSGDDTDQPETRTFLFHVPAGGILFPLVFDQGPGSHLRFIGVGGKTSQISRISCPDDPNTPLDEPSAQDLTPLVETWVRDLGSGVARYIVERGPADTYAAAGETLTAEPGERMTSRRGVVWATLSEGTARYKDIVAIGPGHDGDRVPLTPQSWLHCDTETTVHGMTSTALLCQPMWWNHIQKFHEIAVGCLSHSLRHAKDREKRRLTDLFKRVQADTSKVLGRFATVLDDAGQRRDKYTSSSPTVMACGLVADAIGVSLKSLDRLGRRSDDQGISVEDIARVSRLRVRQVTLSGEWWKQDLGQLVGFVGNDERPVALLKQTGGRRASYCIHDPVEDKITELDAEIARAIAPMAYMLYTPLPERSLTIMDLLKFGIFQNRSDLLTVFIMGAVGGLIALVTPIATALVFDSVVPGHEVGQLMQIGLALVVAAVATYAFKITGDIALLRIEGRMSGGLQAAILDRLLRLPNSFFAQYSAGDLAVRTMMVENIRAAITGIVLSGILSGVFSIFSFALLFYYEPRAAMLATGLFLVLMGVTVWVGYAQLKANFEAEKIGGKIYGMVLQIINGVTKLRLAGAETRAFNLWGKAFGDVRARMITSRKIGNLFGVFKSGYEILAMAAIFGVIGLVNMRADQDPLSTGAFLAFVAAFSSFLAASYQMSMAVVQCFHAAPMYKRAQPIMHALPEVDDSMDHPGTISGEIEVNNLGFRYATDSPRVLNGISMNIHAGESVAIVGTSGCGKSTFIKLLLGFEKANTGGVFYDGKDVRTLDLQALRRQIGVVLQNGKLMPGSIFENIRGASAATEDDAWDAARMAGLEDDIREMPMGMHTMLTEGSSTLSGGQVQRLLIAQALVSKPKILLFDEATSALDNHTQKIVTDSLDGLSVTRIAVAHRLSTVINADCIYVFDQGHIVESGTYADLMKRDGAFAELARRQLI
ncbi:NHLP bacteriocin export ABC transporter permease/ATPase subunit [Magnetovibrio sp. PR-2]|uniref:NHLP bacteriocin export ABC transporter permease/ATPase subunit n=1 Tax=Magnetovibrio sp. PR-2 TaxID=3120356 RepID=UPI002FCDE4DF